MQVYGQLTRSNQKGKTKERLRAKDYARAESTRGASIQGYARRALAEVGEKGRATLQGRAGPVIKALGSLSEEEQKALLLVLATDFTIVSMCKAAANFNPRGGATILSQGEAAIYAGLIEDEGQATADQWKELQLKGKRLAKGKMRTKAAEEE